MLRQTRSLRPGASSGGLLRCSGSVVRPRVIPRAISRVAPRSSHLCTAKSKQEGAYERFWNWTRQERPPWREDKKEMAIAIVVFGVTGTSSVALVRPFLKSTIGLEGTLQDGPWSYRIGSLLLVSPMYAIILITVGTLVGRHAFFAKQGFRILGRFIPNAVLKRIKP